MQTYAAAPLSYKGLLIHLSIDGSMVFTLVAPMHKLEAPTWPELKKLIDEEVG
jgi:hypothetical protein